LEIAFYGSEFFYIRINLPLLEIFQVEGQGHGFGDENLKKYISVLRYMIKSSETSLK
jgi:hypothetical protein